VRRGPSPFWQIVYLDFLDGRLADNLGTQPLRAALIAISGDANVLRAIKEGQIRHCPLQPVEQPIPASRATGLGGINPVTSAPIDAQHGDPDRPLRHPGGDRQHRSVPVLRPSLNDHQRAICRRRCPQRYRRAVSQAIEG
jgi:hypothetical protein